MLQYEVLSNSVPSHWFLLVLCSFLLKYARWGALCVWSLSSWTVSVAIFGKSDLGQTQKKLKGLFMDLGRPWDLGIWLWQRTPAPLCLVCCNNKLDPGNWWKINGLKCFGSNKYILPSSYLASLPHSVKFFFWKVRERCWLWFTKTKMYS